MTAVDALGGVALIAGSVLILIAGIGVVRFGDIYARIHAAAKAPALGVLLVAVGAALIIRTTQAVATALLVVALQMITGPIGVHVLGRSVYLRLRPPLDGPDESAAHNRPADAEE